MARAREEYAAAAEGFSTDYTRQDAAILNMDIILHHLDEFLQFSRAVLLRDGAGTSGA